MKLKGKCKILLFASFLIKCTPSHHSSASLVPYLKHANQNSCQAQFIYQLINVKHKQQQTPFLFLGTIKAFMTGPTASWVNTNQAHIPLILCIPGMMKSDVLFLKAHPVPTYLWTFLSSCCHQNLQYPGWLFYQSSLMLMHIFVWTEFQGIGVNPRQGQGMFLVWLRSGRVLGELGVFGIFTGVEMVTRIYLSAANKLCLILFYLGTSVSSNFFSM